nr:mdm2-binding protein-like isoform X2 [Lytechinus pictus]
MDSFYKFSLQIPRYIIALSSEWLAAEDVQLFQHLAKSLYTNEERSNHSPTPEHSGRTTNDSSSGPESVKQAPIDNVWINIVVPEYGESSEPGTTDTVFHSGWSRVHEQDVEVDDDGQQVVFADMREKFGKARSDMKSLSVTKMREYTGMVASKLDKIADELPVGGYLLDVVWLMPTSTDFPILERPDAFLFSVLRRLEVWHHARITIMLGKGMEGQEHPSLTHWKTFIESKVVELRSSDGKDANVDDILSESGSLAWQGQVKYISSRGTAFPPWQGFSLHRLADDSHRSEPFIEILNPSANSQQDVAGSQQSMDDSFVSISNHELKSKYVVNETLEFIHLANLHEIPSWFVLPGKFELCLKDKEKRQRFSRSKFWMQYLTHRLPGDGQGAICQLSCLEVEGPVPEAQNAGLSTQIWTNGITNNPLNPTVPNVQLKGTRHTFFFLVHGDRRGRCIALPLVSPFMLNGAAHALLACHEEEERSSDAEEDQSAREVLDSLPSISGRRLREEEEELAKMQIKALAMVIEKIRSEGLEINVTPSLLIFLFNYMRKVFYEGYSIDENRSSPASQRPSTDTPEQRPPLEAESRNEEEAMDVERRDEGGVAEAENASEPRPARIDLRTLPTELTQSPSQWVERQALQNRESIANRLRRIRSEDLTLGGFAVPSTDSNTITLSAKEFRSHFKPNGQPKRDDLVIVPPSGVRHSPRTRSSVAGHHNNGPTVQELMQTEFSDSLKLKYHGITYCKEKPDSQSIDQKMMRLQQRCVRQEMSCTFTSHHHSTLAIRTKRKHSESPSTQQSKTRKLSPSAKKKSSQSTPKKRIMPGRTAKTPQKVVGSTPKKGASTPRSRKKRARISTSGGLTPKRLRRSTPVKSTKPEEMTSPRRSARKLAKDHHPTTTTTTISSFTSPSTSSTHQPSSSSAASSSTPSKRTQKHAKDTVKSAESKKARTSSVSRSEKHKMKLRSIVEETLAAKGIDSSHVCFKPCVTRLYTQTKMFVKDLKSSKGLYDEMRKIAEANADFVITFEQNRVATKS